MHMLPCLVDEECMQFVQGGAEVRVGNVVSCHLDVQQLRASLFAFDCQFLFLFLAL